MPPLVPARVFASGRDFGRNPAAMSNIGAQLADRDVAAAMVQHRAALVVLAALGHPETDADWGRAAGRLGLVEDQTWQTLRRKLYGQQVASLRDLGLWIARVGIDVLPTVANRQELGLGS